MKSCLVSSLACPECRAPLELRHIASHFSLAGRQHIDSGVLACERDHLFPILDEVARLTPFELLSDGERDAVADLLSQSTRVVVPEILTEADIEQRIRELVEGRYGVDQDSSEVERTRAEGAVNYSIQEHRGLNKHKYLSLIARRVERADSILEVGAGLPGFMRVVVDHYRPATAVVADLDLGYAWSFRTAGREIDLVKADCRRLPFKGQSFQLLTSAFMLEHVPGWQRAMESLLATGEKTFIAFGPNRWFPYEVGHLDTPLAGTVPKSVAAYLAWVWLRLRGRKRSLGSIRSILDDVHHVSSREFRSHCRKLGGRVENVFPELIEVIARDERATPTRSRRLIRRFPGVTGFIARLLARLGMEPQMYHMVESGRS